MEGLEFEAKLDEFRELGAQVAGCSVDTLEDQQAFAQKQSFRFPLVADPDARLARDFGAFNDEWQLAKRATIVIGEDGTVLKVYPDAPAAGHAQEVLEDLKGSLA